jgi:predicted DNA-binding antitoxin AbrB/MazE fold protein
MTHVDAIYQNGVFRLLGPVDFKENQRVILTIELIQNEDALAWIKQASQFREEMAARHGILPDSAIDIAEDRRR